MTDHETCHAGPQPGRGLHPPSNRHQRLFRGLAFLICAALMCSPIGTLQPAHASTAQAATMTVAAVPVAVRAVVPQASKPTAARTTANLNLRSGPGTKHRRITTLKKGTTVAPTGKKSGVWWQIKAAGKTGWVSSRYLKAVPVAKKQAPKPSKTATKKPAKKQVAKPSKTPAKKPVPKPAAQKTYRWTTANVNLRTGNSTKHRSLGKVRPWTRVGYLKTSAGWSRVSTPQGTGWIKDTYLSSQGKYDVAVYGTLRRGQSAYFLIKGKTSSEKKSKVVSHDLYLRRDKTWWSYMVPGGKTGRVVVERMNFKPEHYSATLKNMDRWERFDPSKPLDNQNYNRKLVTDQHGQKVWAYVASKKLAKYMKTSGTRVTSGDYLRRF